MIALHGTLAPEGAILKRAAATQPFWKGEQWSSFLWKTSQPESIHPIYVEAEDILVLQNAGPRSPSGMPEAGYLPIPKKLETGVKDMVQISDARMSGTAFGTIVLHVTPEADLVVHWRWSKMEIDCLSASAKTIDLLVTPSELERRRSPAPLINTTRTWISKALS